METLKRIKSGDRNNLDINQITAINSEFCQIVTNNTRKNKILSVIITDLPNYYRIPLIIPPVPVDVHGKGVPSDHSGVLALPVTVNQFHCGTEKVQHTVRPIPESLLQNFGSYLVTETWSFLNSEDSSTGMISAFENHTSNLVETFFPVKNITITNFDKP